MKLTWLRRLERIMPERGFVIGAPLDQARPADLYRARYDAKPILPQLRALVRFATINVLCKPQSANLASDQEVAEGDLPPKIKQTRKDQSNQRRDRCLT